MGGTIEGCVVQVDATGKLITDIQESQLAGVPRDERVSVCCAGHETNGIFPPDHQEPESTLLARIGAGGCLELEIIGMNLSEMLGIGVGEQVVVRWP